MKKRYATYLKTGKQHIFDEEQVQRIIANGFGGLYKFEPVEEPEVLPEPEPPEIEEETQPQEDLEQPEEEDLLPKQPSRAKKTAK